MVCMLSVHVAHSEHHVIMQTLYAKSARSCYMTLIINDDSLACNITYDDRRNRSQTHLISVESLRLCF